jgi:hypothetical protein
LVRESKRTKESLLRDATRALYGTRVERARSEICAFLDFRDALQEHDGQPCQDWADGDDPPDYFLWLAGQKTGVEVTTVAVCEDLLASSAELADALGFMKAQAAETVLPQGTSLELLLEPGGGIPHPRRDRGDFRRLFEYAQAFARTDLECGGLCFGGAQFSLWRRRGTSSGLHVRRQGFFIPPDEADPAAATVEAIQRKVRDYGGRPPFRPCWLLVNIRPYLCGSSESARFLSEGVEVPNPGQVQAVFERVYVLTGYVGPGASPIRRLL